MVFKRRRYRIVVIGTKNCDGTITQNCHLMELEGTRAANVRRFLHEDVGLIVPRDFIPMTSCVLFHDPEAGSARYHGGSYPSIMHGIVSHEKFEQCVQKAWTQLIYTAAGHTRGGTQMIVYHCKQGRHRSIACALIVQHVLEVGGAHVATTIVNESTIPCHLCADCRLPDVGRNRALKRAREVFNQIAGSHNQISLHSET